MLNCCYYIWNKVKCVKAWKNAWMPQKFAGLWITLSLLNWDYSLILWWRSLEARHFPKSFSEHQKPRKKLYYQVCDAGLCKRHLQVSGAFCVGLTKINVQGTAVFSELALMLEWYFWVKKKLLVKALQIRLVKKKNVWSLFKRDFWFVF